MQKYTKYVKIRQNHPRHLYKFLLPGKPLNDPSLGGILLLVLAVTPGVDCLIAKVEQKFTEVPRVIFVYFCIFCIFLHMFTYFLNIIYIYIYILMIFYIELIG